MKHQWHELSTDTRVRVSLRTRRTRVERAMRDDDDRGEYPVSGRPEKRVRTGIFRPTLATGLARPIYTGRDAWGCAWAGVAPAKGRTFLPRRRTEIAVTEGAAKKRSEEEAPRRVEAAGQIAVHGGTRADGRVGQRRARAHGGWRLAARGRAGVNANRGYRRSTFPSDPELRKAAIHCPS